MADTVVSDAARFPQDEGYANITDGSETWGSAGHLGLLATATANGPFVYDGLTFANHDATNDTVDVQAGIAALDMSQGAGVSTQSTLGGSSAPSYDTSLSKAGAIVVECPTATTVGVTDTALNPIWIAYATDSSVSGVSPGDVYIRHENGGGVSAPPHPHIKLGEANPDDSTADFRAGYDNPPDYQGWREDPAGPWTTTDASVTLAPDGRYDEIKVWGTVWPSGGGGNTAVPGLQVNGTTATNYRVLIEDGNVSTGLSQWDDLFSITIDAGAAQMERTYPVEFTITGRWDTGGGGNTQSPAWHKQAGPNMQTGGGPTPAIGGDYNGSITPPLESLTIVNNGGNWGGEFHLAGRHENTVIG